MLTLRVTYFISKMAAAAAEMGGRVFRKRGNIPLYQKRNMHEYFGVRVPRIQNGMARVPRIQNGIQIGDNLAHK